MAVTESILQKGPEMLGPSSYTPSRRDPEALAASIASHSQANGMPPEQVASMWVIQKGPKFVDILLSTPTYRSMPEEEKARVRSSAVRAFRDNMLEQLDLDGPTEERHDKRWAFWNAGYTVF